MAAKKVLIIGGPSTGKTALIEALEAKGYFCFHEISRAVTLAAREEGIQQLFITDPLLFSRKLMEGRILQFKEGEKSNKELVFFDRGIPDVVAYMDCVNQTYGEEFINASKDHVYDIVFMLLPWKKIYTSDNERYESFEDAEKIHRYLEATYQTYGYSPIVVPFASITERIEFITTQLNNK